MVLLERLEMCQQLIKVDVFGHVIVCGGGGAAVIASLHHVIAQFSVRQAFLFMGLRPENMNKVLLLLPIKMFLL